MGGAPSDRGVCATKDIELDATRKALAAAEWRLQEMDRARQLQTEQQRPVAAEQPEQPQQGINMQGGSGDGEPPRSCQAPASSSFTHGPPQTQG
eukprot:gnl/TRDRNA2_/TRDRNA2_150435_c0_seq1.p3 gnl/TRDRNA2_/TRDRNA2_150435_c0~~gnl/TRDRNA2_/TRDRNA2_150435_c0_seq1.p3  ORF type:complete len:102 (+),score=24.47 gnl/TRDRNA2_/TRDRNA2_150435_c0_seq1:27-308(+)